MCIYPEGKELSQLHIYDLQNFYVRTQHVRAVNFLIFFLYIVNLIVMSVRNRPLLCSHRFIDPVFTSSEIVKVALYSSEYVRI